MHVLISVSAALLMQTPGVHISALDAAMRVERAAISSHAARPGGEARACPCASGRRAN